MYYISNDIGCLRIPTQRNICLNVGGFQQAKQDLRIVNTSPSTFC